MEMVCYRVAIIDRGRAACQGSMAELIRNALKDLFIESVEPREV